MRAVNLSSFFSTRQAATRKSLSSSSSGQTPSDRPPPLLQPHYFLPPANLHEAIPATNRIMVRRMFVQYTCQFLHLLYTLHKCDGDDPNFENSSISCDKSSPLGFIAFVTLILSLTLTMREILVVLYNPNSQLRQSDPRVRVVPRLRKSVQRYPEMGWRGWTRNIITLYAIDIQRTSSETRGAQAFRTSKNNANEPMHPGSKNLFSNWCLPSIRSKDNHTTRYSAEKIRI